LNKKILALSLILILTVICVSSIVTSVKAQSVNPGTGQYITQYSIVDAQSGVNLLTKDFATGATSGNNAISENEELDVTVTISFPATTGTDYTLSTAMLHSATQSNYYWQQGSTNYSLGSSNLNQNYITFPVTQGQLVISCYGLTPSNKVEQTTPNGLTLNVPTPIQLVLLTDPSGNILDEVNPSIIDGAIINYNTLLSTKEASLKSYESSGAPSGWITLYKNVIASSQTLNTQGFTAGAIALLNGLDVSPPASASSQIVYLPIAIVFAVIAAVFAFMFIRIRGRISYFQLVVEDQIKDLEGLTMRASKIDRTMSSSLESVKDRLKRLVGM
jgi:hypothetical protein